MLDFWKIYKGKAVAIRVLRPLVEHSTKSFPGNTSPNWLHPHVLGILATTTTLIAECSCGILRSSAMANVQAGVISKLTDAGNEIIGERIYLLSSTQNQIFLAGCDNGVKLFDAIPAENLCFHKSAIPVVVSMQITEKIYRPASDTTDACLLQLWLEMTEDYLSAGGIS